MTNSDLGRLLRSDEVQRVLRVKTHERKRQVLKRNPLKNNRVMAKLNPYAIVQRRAALKTTLGLNKKAQKKSAKATKGPKVAPKAKTPAAASKKTTAKK
jgi:large subunit ribosomal protein L4e